LFAGIRRAGKLFAALLGRNYEGVIIFSGAGMSFYERILMSAICRLFRVRDVFIIVDGWFLEGLGRGGPSLHIIRLLLKIPHRLAACGSRWSKAFCDLGVASDRIVPIHFWLDESFPVARGPKVAPDRPIRFLFIGWMIKEKGVNELLSAIRELRGIYEFTVTFIGGGTLLESVRSTIKTSGWEESISALGWISKEDFGNVFEAADIFVLPSYAEGFPLSLIEAFSQGLPAICSDVGGISDSLHDGVNGYLIPPRQTQPLRLAMANYIENPGLIADHSRAALEIFKANHNAENNGKRIFESLN
jgi:glycosyltransferase involved in cell wall biosynthesis